MKRKEYVLIWAIAVVLGLLLLTKFAMAADVLTMCDWDGLQVNGQAEKSLPVQIILFDADTLDVYTQGSVNGPVVGFALPTFSLVAPANEVRTVHVAAKAVDSAGNVSAPSGIQTITVAGGDTLPPGAVIMNITIQD